LSFIFKPIDETNIHKFLSWHYEPPYDIYNLAGPLDEAALAYFMDPQNACHSITDEVGDLLAFCSFGPDGQVLGGDYSAEALDIGLGVHPDLTGQGQGSRFVEAVLEYARQTFAPTMFRVTIAAFNKRALRVWEKAGFQRVDSFPSSYDGRLFIILNG
jgi:GNAT superfamily N-acetyltransferase